MTVDRRVTREYEVWIEGYAATGEHGAAKLVGVVDAESFEQACELLHNPKWGEYTPPTDDRPPMYWACRLFDNEADARESYG